MSKTFIAQFSSMVRISGTPSRPELARAFNQGFRRIVNVSGTSLAEIYDPQEMACWKMSEFRMRDLFTDGEGAEKERGPFASLATPDERQAYYSACRAVQTGVAALESSLVLCKLGVGRSPAVVFGALRSGFGLSSVDAHAAVIALRPQAMISKTTESAAEWLLARADSALA